MDMKVEMIFAMRTIWSRHTLEYFRWYKLQRKVSVAFLSLTYPRNVKTKGSKRTINIFDASRNK